MTCSAPFSEWACDSEGEPKVLLPPDLAFSIFINGTAEFDAILVILCSLSVV